MSTKATKPWFVDAFGGNMSDQYIRYMSEEWGWEKRGDQALFEKLCLEGAQAGLSWATILKKREGYRTAFHNFDLVKCSRMTTKDIDALVGGDGSIIRHRGKCESVVSNAQCVLALIEEKQQSSDEPPVHGYFDDFIWSFVDHTPQINKWTSLKDMPAETPASIDMSKQLKKLGFKFVGSKICYSLMQSCGLVIDHLYDTPEWHAAVDRINNRSPSASRVTIPPPATAATEEEDDAPGEEDPNDYDGQRRSQRQRKKPRNA